MNLKKDEWITICSYDCQLPGRPEDYEFPYGTADGPVSCQRLKITHVNQETGVVTLEGTIRWRHKP